MLHFMNARNLILCLVTILHLLVVEASFSNFRDVLSWIKYFKYLYVNFQSISLKDKLNK